jgi:hypothetical protein
MTEKGKETKKTLTDELLEDNFFKPPIEEVIEETAPEQKPVSEAPKESEEEKSELLFDDFLKSPVEEMPQEETPVVSDKTSSLSVPETPVSKPSVTPGTKIMVASVDESKGSKLKVIIAVLSGVIVLLIGGSVYVFTHRKVSQPEQNNLVVGAQKVEINHNKEQAAKPPLAKTEAVQEVQQQAETPVAKINNEQKGATPQPANKIAENIPPVATPQPGTEITKQFEVILEDVKSKSAVNNARSIGEAIDNSLKFDITENKKTNTLYTLFVDKIYPSEGEATADNLKLMVANISNASIVKADGGYRILIGKYTSKAKAMSDIKNVKSAGLNGLVKETENVIYTYNIKVYPFKSIKQAEDYQTKVKRLAPKITFMEIK